MERDSGTILQLNSNIRHGFFTSVCPILTRTFEILYCPNGVFHDTCCSRVSMRTIENGEDVCPYRPLHLSLWFPVGGTGEVVDSFNRWSFAEGGVTWGRGELSGCLASTCALFSFSLLLECIIMKCNL